MVKILRSSQIFFVTYFIYHKNNLYQVIFTYFLHLKTAFSGIPEQKAIVLERHAVVYHFNTESQGEKQVAKKQKQEDLSCMCSQKAAWPLLPINNNGIEFHTEDNCLKSFSSHREGKINKEHLL